MAYKRKYPRAYIKKATSARYSPYRRAYGVRKGGYRGFRGVQGKRYRSRATRGFGGSYRASKYVPKVHSHRAMSRVYRKPLSVPRNKALATALALAPSGTLIYGGVTDRIVWDSVTQGVTSDDNLIVLSSVSDFASVLTSALARIYSTPTTATVAPIPKFWIRSAVCKIQVVSRCQTGMDVWFYPAVARYASSSTTSLWTGAQAVSFETRASSTSTTPDVNNIGWTPFQSEAITSSWKLGRPKKVHLEGGQSYTYTLKDLRPLYVTPGKLGSIGNTAASIPGRTQACYMICRGVVVNDATTKTDIGLSGGALDIQTLETYDWVSPATPYHFNDNFINSADVEIGSYDIIQPQTGVVTTDPVQGI